MNYFCDFCGMSQKLISTICEWSDYHIWLYRQPRQFCETSVEVANYVITFCETMWKAGFAEIKFSQNSCNFGRFPMDFPSLIFSHSNLGIPFTFGQKGL